MNKIVKVISAAGVGAGLMYLFDPDRGTRRRALLRNKAEHATKIATDAAGKTRRDVRNHLLGAVAEFESLFRSAEATDEVLEARVRSKMGRVVSHPHAIDVKVTDGLVTLRGPILIEELHPFLDAVIAVGGVKNIENRLEVHESAGDVPALQGGRRREGEHIGPFKTNWSPTTRLIATATGGALAIYGLKRRGLTGSIASALGITVVTRALTNLETRRLVGIDGDVREIDIEKTINVDASLDKVFTYWSHPENFPEFMSHVREVRKIGDGLYRWTVGGPAGLAIEWDGQITDFEFNKLYAWKSLPGAMIRQSGTTRFDSNPDGSTRIDVKMSYLPPAGALGHAIAEFLGVDPKHEMDDDLMRMKSFIETRVHPHDAAHPLGMTEAAGLV
jgi:uncharacterized membrane protein